MVRAFPKSQVKLAQVVDLMDRYIERLRRSAPRETRED